MVNEVLVSRLNLKLDHGFGSNPLHFLTSGKVRVVSFLFGLAKPSSSLCIETLWTPSLDIILEPTHFVRGSGPEDATSPFPGIM